MNPNTDRSNIDVMASSNGVSVARMKDGVFWIYIPECRCPYPALAGKWTVEKYPHLKNNGIYVSPGEWARFKKYTGW